MCPSLHTYMNTCRLMTFFTYEKTSQLELQKYQLVHEDCPSRCVGSGAFLTASKPLSDLLFISEPAQLYKFVAPPTCPGFFSLRRKGSLWVGGSEVRCRDDGAAAGVFIVCDSIRTCFAGCRYMSPCCHASLFLMLPNLQFRRLSLSCRLALPELIAVGRPLSV